MAVNIFLNLFSDLFPLLFPLYVLWHLKRNKFTIEVVLLKGAKHIIMVKNLDPGANSMAV